MANDQIWVSKDGSNSNSGSASNPLKTIQAAVDRASSGTDVMVEEGTYTETVRIRKDGISLISADGDQAATIKAASQGGSAISGFGVENITIKGFEIDAGSNANGIHFGMSGKGFNDPIRDLTIQDNVINGAGQDGIKVSQAYGVKILNNEINDSGQEGIDFVAVNNSRIAGNEIDGADGPSALGVKGGSTNVDIVNNKVHDTAVAGISVGGWTTDKWMWPGARSYEAKDLTVTGNEVWDTTKAAILVSGARDSLIADNYLHPDNDYDAVIWLDRSTASHPSPIYSENITIRDNLFERDDWLRVNRGNDDGLKVSGNSIASGDQKGAWGSSEAAGDVGGDVAGASGSSDDTAAVAPIVASDTALGDGAVPDVIAISKADLPEGYDAGPIDDEPDLMIPVGEDLIVFTQVEDAGFQVTDAEGAEAPAGDYAFFKLTTDGNGENVSISAATWQALEDATLADAVPVEQTPVDSGTANQGTDGWLL